MARAAHRAGVTLDDGLLLWSLAGARPTVAGETVAPPVGAGYVDGHPASDADGRSSRDVPDAHDASDALGAVLEAATDDASRRAHGLHVTPRWLADELVSLVLPAAAAPGEDWPTVCDPACGGGAFLVAAARHLHRLGADRRTVVRHLLWGADIDPVGLAAAEAALAIWAGEPPPAGRLVVADPLRHGGGAWPDAPAAGFDAVVGNPPFQNQLGRATARSDDDRRHLRARFGPAVRAYTDTAWLFLLVGCDLVRPGGRVVLVEPQSVVAARDAEAVRAAVDERATLRDLWVDDGRVFDAAVRVCAPVLERRLDGVSGAIGSAASPDPPALTGDGTVGTVDTDWGRLWARALDLPFVHLPQGETLGQRATVIAGFRDQYYGLVDVVRELAPTDGPDVVAPLVTSGAVDWATCTWGERPIRYAKRRWDAPVVDLRRLPSDAPPVAQRWVRRTRAPKLVVATQTRVVEAAVDVEGTWVPSVPTLAVVPHDAGDLWRLAAAVLSPAATAWLARRSAGTGLDRGALKVAGPDLATLPLPLDDEAWAAAADALRAHLAGPTPAGLDRYLAAAGRAYATDASLAAWWRRLAGTAVRPGGSPD